MVQSAVISCFNLKLYPPVACLTCYFLSLSVSPTVFSSVNHSLFTEVLAIPSLLVSLSVPSPLLMFDLCLLPVPSCFPGSYFVFLLWFLDFFSFCTLPFVSSIWGVYGFGIFCFFVIKAHFSFNYLSACVSCIRVPFVLQWHTLHRRHFWRMRIVPAKCACRVYTGWTGGSVCPVSDLLPGWICLMQLDTDSVSSCQKKKKTW